MMQDWERETYLLHAKMDNFKKRIDEAILNIKEAIQNHPGIWAVSYSGGKDSTVLLDLCVKAGWTGPALFFYYSEYETLPECFDMVKWAEKIYNIKIHRLHVPGAFDVYKELGHFFITPTTEQELKAMRRNMTAYKKKVNAFVREQGWVGQFLGMRMAESNQRKKTLGKRGPLYFAETRGTWTCCPLYRWSGKDIWAYIAANNLPYLSLYDAEGEDRERLRSEFTYLVGDAIWRHGAGIFIKKHNPKMWNYIISEWPDIKNWS